MPHYGRTEIKAGAECRRLLADATDTLADCSRPDDYVADASDCDDTDASVYPGRGEIPGDGIDQDCDGVDLLLDSGDSGHITDSEKADTGDRKEGGCGCASTRGSRAGGILVAIGLLGLVVRRRRLGRPRIRALVR